MDKKILSEAKNEAIATKIKQEIEEALELAYTEEPIVPDESIELNDVYKPFEYKEVKLSSITKEIRFIDAVSDGLRQST